MNKLFSMAPLLRQNNMQVILIQIDEAHSDGWPLGTLWSNGIESQPKPQSSFGDRCARANHFLATYQPPYPVFVDGWDNQFAETFQAWPDKFHCVNSDMVIIAKSEYGVDGDQDALIKEDYTVLLNRLILDGQRSDAN